MDVRKQKWAILGFRLSSDGILLTGTDNAKFASDSFRRVTFPQETQGVL